ncbi:MAG: sulfur carrier protein ThiS adenylyltransferase ThiF [Spirochaetes bacterium]|nr:sulfur carrier protein ThiS adenylyltransferase ThiF [Spirochaetota bacterium]
MKIGIAGCGGVGSNVANNLVRAGINWLQMVDYDSIEHSNLNRQFYFYDQIGKPKVQTLAENLKRINPLLSLKLAQIELTRSNIAEIFYDCDVVVEGLDQADAKKMLLESFASSNKVIISACGIAGFEVENIQVKQLGNSYIVGDFQSDVQREKLYSHKVQLVAAMMSYLVIKQGEFYG